MRSASHHRRLPSRRREQIDGWLLAIFIVASLAVVGVGIVSVHLNRGETYDYNPGSDVEEEWRVRRSAANLD